MFNDMKRKCLFCLVILMLCLIIAENVGETLKQNRCNHNLLKQIEDIHLIRILETFKT